MKPFFAMTRPSATELNGRRFLLLLALYFLIHLGVRVFLSSSAELDESEQLLLTQDMRLGYGSQPPLYTWIQAGLFFLCGINVFALAVFKNFLLFLSYFFVYLSARELTRDSTRSVIAMLSLLLIPQIFWESQRDLTHSVLGTAMAAGSLFVMLRLLKTGRLRYYVLFGLCAGFGILAKYNYGIFLIALLLAAGSIRNFRPRVLNRKMGLAVLCLLLVSAPHLYWMVTHTQATLSQVGKFHVASSAGRLALFVLGFKSLGVAVLSFLGLLVPVVVLFFHKRGASVRVVNAHSDDRALILRTLLAGLGLCVLMIVFFKVSVFKDRWMQPLLFATPLYLVMLPWARWNLTNARRYAAFTAVVAVGTWAVIAGRVLHVSDRGSVSRLSAPYAALASQLRQAGFHGGHIMAQDRWVGGNLKLCFPESVVEAPEVPSFAAPADSDRVVVWNATNQSEMPEMLRDFVRVRAGTDAGSLPTQWIEAPYSRASGRSMRLGLSFLPHPP